MVQTSDGSIAYTRNGSFGLTNGAEGLTLADSEGNPVLDSNGISIVFDSSFEPSKITVNEYGQICYPNEQGMVQPIGITIGIAQFNNPNGLLKLSNSLFKETEASGFARLEEQDGTLKKSKILQGYLEGSNVQAVDEIVNLIVAQRAYEMNSKIITATDEMLQQANNLR